MEKTVRVVALEQFGSKLINYIVNASRTNE